MNTSQRRPPTTSRDEFELIPVPEAQETDWAEWEDSVAFQESQLDAFQVTEKIPLAPDHADLFDPFSSVTKNCG